MPTVLENSYDNNSGELNFSAGAFSNYPSDTFTLATVTFQANAQSDGTPIDLNLSGFRQSNVIYAGSSVLGSTEGSTVVIDNIDNSVLVCSVTLQGRPTPPHSRWSVPLSISLTVPGESDPAYEFTRTTNDNGTFSIAGIEPGAYDLRIKKRTSLQNTQPITVVAGTNSLDCGTLREGDSNNDNQINIIDFSLLASTFSKCEGYDGYDERANFNGDGCVNILDFSLLAHNFAQIGDARRSRLPIHTSQPNRGDVSLRIEPTATTIQTGEHFTVSVQLHADEPIDGAQIHLGFDPEVLEVEQMRADTALPLELANQFDNYIGKLFFAAGSLTDFPEGSFDVLHIQLKALAPSEETELAFQFDLSDGTDVTSGGSSVLGSHTNGTITIKQIPTAVTLDTLTTTSLSASWLWALAPMLTILAGMWIMRRRP